MRILFYRLYLLVTLGYLIILTGCGGAAPTREFISEKPTKGYEDLVVGFAQIGAESEWRTANTNSIKEAADQLGVELSDL